MTSIVSNHGPQLFVDAVKQERERRRAGMVGND